MTNNRRDYGRWHDRTGRILLAIFMLIAIYLFASGDLAAAAFIAVPFGIVLYALLRRG